MGLFDLFPYTSGHTLNLDWIIKTVKKLGGDFQIFKDEVNAKVAAEVAEAVPGITAEVGRDFQIFKDEVNAKVATIPAEVAAEVAEAVPGIAAEVGEKVMEALSAITPENIGALPGIESAEHPDCYYRSNDGRVEWLNPPLLAGIEYRTTERWQGKPVYTKVVNCGKLPAQGSVSYTEFTSSATKILKIAGFGDDGFAVPYVSTDAKVYISGTVVSGTGQVVIYAESGNLTAVGCSAQVWYTKN